MTDNLARRRSGRLTLLALALVFIGPVVLAYGALLGHWFTPASTNKGTLLAPPVQLAELGLRALDGQALPETQGRWRLLYVNGTACAAACEHNLYTLHQVWTALGKEQERVAPLFASARPASLPAVKGKVGPAFGNLLWARFEDFAPALNARLQFEPGSALGRIYLVDPRGTIPLVYELSDEPARSAQVGKDILKDLKHLLKLSNIG